MAECVDLRRQHRELLEEVSAFVSSGRHDDMNALGHIIGTEKALRAQAERALKTEVEKHEEMAHEMERLRRESSATRKTLPELPVQPQPAPAPASAVSQWEAGLLQEARLKALEEKAAAEERRRKAAEAEQRRKDGRMAREMARKEEEIAQLRRELTAVRQAQPEPEPEPVTKHESAASTAVQTVAFSIAGHPDRWYNGAYRLYHWDPAEPPSRMILKNEAGMYCYCRAATHQWW